TTPSPSQPAPPAEAGASGRANAWTRATQAVFGQMAWTPPPWLAALIARIRQRPGLYLGSLLGLLVAAWLAHWLITRPKPVIPGALSVELHAPELTDYERKPPTVHRLSLTFSDSAAPLKQIGNAPVGVSLSPELKGAWTWEDD
ncbi:hypothetical protein JTP67_31325, partial [Streptomyces sp. S12]|nr:hypothetical protein [Streptomyces sp. S12]